jgi:hypothetical protein
MFIIIIIKDGGMSRLLHEGRFKTVMLNTDILWARVLRSWSINRAIRCVKLFGLTGISMFFLLIVVAILQEWRRPHWTRCSMFTIFSALGL